MTELLGADLMEHNILHNSIGITEALDILQRFYDIDNLDLRGDPHRKYIAQMEADSPVSDYLQLQQDEDEAGYGERPGQHHEVPVPYEPLVQVVTSPGGPGLLVIPLQSNNKNYTSWSLFI